MGPPRLLAEGQDHPERQGGSEHGPRQARPGVHQQEVEGHQGETRRSVGSRKAGSARQRVRPILEKVDVGQAAAEARQVPRTVHVGRKLEEAHDRGAEQDGHYEVSGLAVPGGEPWYPQAAYEHGETGNADGPDDHRSAAVNEVVRPPGARADPGLRMGVEEERRRDAAVEVECRDQDGADDARRRRQPEVREPESFRVRKRLRIVPGVHGQKLRFV